MTSVSITASGDAKARTRTGTLARTIRRLHSYLGVFFAPALLFFALTGATQVLNLHKPVAGVANPMIVQLASLHKRQAFDPRVVKPEPKAKPQAKGDDTRPHLPGAVILLKTFALGAAFSLAASVLTGLYMSFKQMRERTLNALLFAAGVGLPLAAIALLR